MRIRDAFTFFSFGLMIFVAIAYIGALGVRVGPPSRQTHLSMEVLDINSLVPDSNVLLRGVPIGKVTHIQPLPSGAVIDFFIDGRYSVPVDSQVRLENLSALGETYISFFPRQDGGPTLRDGQRLTTENVQQPASIAALAAALSRVLHQADPEALERIVNEADNALPDANSVLPNLARTSVLLRNAVADMNGRGKMLLDNSQALLRGAGWLGPLLADLAPQARTGGLNLARVFAGVQAAEPVVTRQMGDNFDRLLDRVQKFLDDNGGDLKVLGQQLLPHLKGIGGSLMNVDSGQILTNLLATLPDDGVVTLHVAVPQPNSPTSTSEK